MKSQKVVGVEVRGWKMAAWSRRQKVELVLRLPDEVTIAIWQVKGGSPVGVIPLNWASA